MLWLIDWLSDRREFLERMSKPFFCLQLYECRLSYAMLCLMISGVVGLELCRAHSQNRFRTFEELPTKDRARLIDRLNWYQITTYFAAALSTVAFCYSPFSLRNKATRDERFDEIVAVVAGRVIACLQLLSALLTKRTVADYYVKWNDRIVVSEQETTGSGQAARLSVVETRRLRGLCRVRSSSFVFHMHYLDYAFSLSVLSSFILICFILFDETLKCL